MDDSQGDGTRKAAAEELILRTIAAHADSLLRTARRHSICLDDAHDAYQRSIEIFMAHAHRLDAARAAGWLHVVVKREAQAIRSDRRKLVQTTDVDLDATQPSSTPTPEEQLLSFDTISRSAEALKRLRPNELRALWLRAQGHSYSEIQTMTGWSYSKVNRCMTEGRRSFLERYAAIESGAECERWLPVISAMVDGEATSQDLLDVRPHLRNCTACRATLKALRESSTPLAAVLPVPFLVLDAGTGDHILQTLMRLYEGFAGPIHERAVNSVTKAQALIELSTSGKVAAVAASAAVVAGGGYASVERAVDEPQPVRSVAAKTRAEPAQAQTPVTSTPPATAATPKAAVKSVRAVVADAVGDRRSSARLYAPEFRPKDHSESTRASPFHTTRASRRIAPPPPPPPPQQRVAPEFVAQSAPEFGP